MSDQEQVPEEDLEGGSAQSEPETFPARSESETFPARSEADTAPAPSESESSVAQSEPAPSPVVAPNRAGSQRGRAANMLPGRQTRRSGLERVVVRSVATGGVIGIGVAVAAILGANHVQAWIMGLVVSALSVVLAAILWSSERL